MGVLEEKQSRSYKIEHFPDLDVILNLDCEDPESRNIILALLQEFFSLKPEDRNFDSLRNKITSGRDKDDNPLFYLKQKFNPQYDVDFILGRIKTDPLNPTTRHDITTKSRYAFAGVLNEIILSPKIKDLIASDEFQKLARRFGFADLTFSEPIAAFSYRGLDGYKKFLVYRHLTEEKFFTYYHRQVLENLAEELKRMFLSNGIIPHDLRFHQFMINKQDGQLHLILVDTEVFTEIKTS